MVHVDLGLGASLLSANNLLLLRHDDFSKERILSGWSSLGPALALLPLSRGSGAGKRRATAKWSLGQR